MIREYSLQIDEIKEEVKRRVEREMLLSTEVRQLRKQQEIYTSEVSSFKQQAKEFFGQLRPGAELLVKTQTGPNGGEVIKEYNGKLVKYDKLAGHIDFSCPDRLEGKPFTIGFSSLLYAELI